MVKNLALIFCIFFCGCQIKEKQIIKEEKFDYKIINFDTVSKELQYTSDFNRSVYKTFKDIIQYWFDSKIKTNGFNGNLIVNFQKIDFERIRNSNYYKFSISLTVEFIEIKNNNKKNSYNVNANEYGEITGNFSIIDQENLEINLMHKAIESISSKLNEVN